jgi:cell division protein FtsZ
MIQFGIHGVQFISANTDAQALANSIAPTKLLLGQRASHGLGAGGDPRNGLVAAEESANEICEALNGADMVFIAAGMGGGTGTGSAAVAARTARELGAITVAIVTSPFAFEGPRRYRNAQAGINQLREHCHSLIVVPNDKLLSIADRNVSFEDSLRVADEVLRQGVQGMAELVTRPSLINVDFANVCSLMQMPGGAFLAMGTGKGANKTVDAICEMLNHKLLEAETLRQASGVLVHFTGGNDLTLHEIHQAISLVRRAIPEDAQFVMGAMTDESMTGRAQVILVATGVGSTPMPLPESRAPAANVVYASQPNPVAQPAVVEPAPEPALAQSLFAAIQPNPKSVEWVVAEEPAFAAAPALAPALSPDNLDLPAFLRRRRSLK